MTTTTVTPNPNGNPFDVPLDSEIQESQQRQAATPAKPSGYVNPFDEPLASEIAEQKHAEAAKANPEEEASQTRQMLVSGLTGMPTPNMNERDKQSFETGKAVGGGTATLLSAAPLLASIAPHLPDLDKAWKIAVGLGGASATVDHLLHVLGVLHGKSR